MLESFTKGLSYFSRERQLKKLISSLIALSVSTAAFAANDNDNYMQPAKTFSPNVYVQVDGGYDMTNFAKLYPDFINTTDYSHANGNFIAGVAAGYEVMPHLALEAGFMYPLQNMEHKGHDHKISKHYSLYAAAKFMVPVGVSINLFGLGGLGYTHITDANAILNNHTAYTSSNSNSALGFVGGAGLDFNVTKNIFVGGEYLYFAGSNKDDHLAKPKITASQMFLLTGSFKINM